jgi:eukaryotic-like serine/threonine-protein kinase
MKPDRWQQINKLFQATLALDPADRDAFLDHACKDDTALRREVESLIASHDSAGSFIESPAVERAAPLFTDARSNSVLDRQIGPYRILSQIGAGGMGEVYLAQDARLGRKVALKLLPDYFTRDEQRVRRFQQEARAASALNHPSIITIHEIGEAESRHYIATEFVEGETLRHRMSKHKMSLTESLDVAVQVTGALAAAHQAGIVHRDIKPENIMLRPDGIVKVLDFGLAKLAEQRAVSVESQSPTVVKVETDPGTVMGTASYMSPEQARGQAVDARTDIFSLGVVIYEILAGRAPFEGETPSDVIAAILKSVPPPLTQCAPEAPTELQRIVSKAMRKEAEERYQTIKDMLLDLKSLKQEIEYEARQERSSHPEISNATIQSNPGGIGTENNLAAQTAEAPTRTTSSAEYLVSEIKRHKRGAVLIIVALLVSVAAIVYFSIGIGRQNAIVSLAVLPFVNVGADPDAEYLSDGVTESLINSLSQLSNLKVMSRNSVFRYKEREQQAASPDAQAVGRELGVRGVLTGRIVQRGDMLSISVELVDVKDNTHIWGEQYDRKLNDLLAVQREVAKEITQKLRVKLTGEDQKRLTKDYTENTEAYQLYLKGRYYWNKRTEEGIKKSIVYFEEAIRKDPRYALAYAGLSDSYYTLPGIGLYRPKEAMPKAKAAVTKALEIDDTLAEAHASLGPIKLYYDWDWPGAESEFKRAIELNPSYATAHQWYAEYLITLGRVDEAVREIRRAQELDPFSLTINTQVGWIFYYARQYDQAIEAYRKALELDPNFAYAHGRFTRAYIAKGMYEEAVNEYSKSAFITRLRPGAEAILREAYGKSGWKGFLKKQIELEKEAAKQVYISPYRIANHYALLGENDQAFDWLDKACEERAISLVQLKVDPQMDGLRRDPRYEELLRRIGFPQ